MIKIRRMGRYVGVLKGTLRFSTYIFINTLLVFYLITSIFDTLMLVLLFLEPITIYVFSTQFFFDPHLRVYLLSSERGREREREKHQPVASLTQPDQRLNLQPRYVP